MRTTEELTKLPFVSMTQRRYLRLKRKIFLIAVIFGMALSTGLTRAATLEKGQVYLFDSCTRPNYFMCHKGSQALVTKIKEPRNRGVAMFRVIQGLAKEGKVYVSLESVERPRSFMSCSGNTIRLQARKDRQFNPLNATFKAVENQYGIVFMSCSRPRYVIWLNQLQLALKQTKTNQPMPKSAHWIPVKRWRNFAGEERYIKSSSQVAKLYLTVDALVSNDPTKGFNNTNTFKNSCGPDAAFNMFRWYGIKRLSYGKSTCPMSKTPKERVHWLGSRMKTNKWSILSIKAYQLPGTSTRNFIGVTRNILKKCIPQSYAFYYERDTQGNDNGYDRFRYLLARGNPIAVCYKTASLADGANGKSIGHFALIVGLEGGTYPSYRDGTLILANGTRMSWERFKEKWERDYLPFSEEVMRMINEYPYPAAYISKHHWEPPVAQGGHSIGRPPKRIK